MIFVILVFEKSIDVSHQPNTALLKYPDSFLVQLGSRPCYTRRLSSHYKKAVPVTTTRPSDKVKQLVLPSKVIGFAYQSMPLSKVKQLVLLHQLIYFDPQSPQLGCPRWLKALWKEAFLEVQACRSWCSQVWCCLLLLSVFPVLSLVISNEWCNLHTYNVI